MILFIILCFSLIINFHLFTCNFVAVDVLIVVVVIIVVVNDDVRS